MPVNVVQADKQAAQSQRNQPDSIQWSNLQTVPNKRHHAAHRQRISQNGKTRGCRTQAADRTANSSNPAAQRFMK